MNGALIINIALGVFLAELVMSFVASGVQLYRQRKLAKQRAADQEAFSNFMLSKLTELDDASEEATN